MHGDHGGHGKKLARMKSSCQAISAAWGCWSRRGGFGSFNRNKIFILAVQAAPCIPATTEHGDTRVVGASRTLQCIRQALRTAWATLLAEHAVHHDVFYPCATHAHDDRSLFSANGASYSSPLPWHSGRSVGTHVVHRDNNISVLEVVKLLFIVKQSNPTTLWT
jgi:hypothetical protein